jgi:RND family efflux transporter MFP subunit
MVIQMKLFWQGWACLGLIAATLMPLGASAQTMGCLIEPDRIAEVGSPVIGVIESIGVERGDFVRKGDVLVVLRAHVEQASLSVAHSRAESSADIDSARAGAKFNRERLTRAEDLFRQNFISQQALDQARTEADMAEQKLAQARDQRRIFERERDLSAAQLALRTIRSPIDGVVAERYLSAGERVDDKPILRLAKVDPLRVQLVVPTSLYGQLRTDSFVSVVPELPGATARTARVALVDKVVDAASNTFRVQLELPNADRALPAGLRCRADLAQPARVSAVPVPPR